jgi:hypothetical protein
MQLELTNDEIELVRRILSSYLSDLRMEIADTDNPTYRRQLHEEEDAVRAIIARLGAPVP